MPDDIDMPQWEAVRERNGKPCEFMLVFGTTRLWVSQPSYEPGWILSCPDFGLRHVPLAVSTAKDAQNQGARLTLDHLREHVRALRMLPLPAYKTTRLADRSGRPRNRKRRVGPQQALAVPPDAGE